MAFLETNWTSLLDNLDDVGRELPYVFFAACPESDLEPCLVVDDDEFELDDDAPAVARRLGFTRGLLVDDLQQVIENLRQQDPTAERDVLLRAIAY